MGLVTIQLYWRWEDMCGPEGLHPWDPKTRDMGYCFQRLFILIPALFLLAITSSYYVGRQVNWVIRGKLQQKVIVARCAATLCLAVLPLFKLYRIIQGDTRALGIDYFTCGAEFIAWLVHFAFLLALRQRLGISPRGPVFVMVLWSVTALLSITGLRTLILMDKPYAFSVVVLVLQVVYAITLLPSEGVTTPTYYPSNSIGSQYSQIGENHPLLLNFNDDQSALGAAFSAPLASKFLFYWVNPLFKRGLEQKLKDPDDLYDLPVNLSCNTISMKIDKALIGNVDKFLKSEERPRLSVGYGSINDENEDFSRLPAVDVIVPSKRQNVSLFRALHSCFGFQFYGIGILKLMADIAGFAGPLLLNRVVNFIEDPTIDPIMGYTYAGGLLLSSLIGAFCDSHFNMFMSVIGLKLRAAIVSTIFRKTLSIPSSELNKKFSIGEVTNFMSTDTDRIVNACPSFHAIWSIPLQLGVTLYLLHTQVGIAFLAGVVFSIVLIPINRYVANKIGSLSTDLMRHKDGRVSFMSEVIKNIKTIKLYVWEDFFMDKVEDERTNEIKYLKGRKYLDAICVFLWATTPVVVTTLTLSTYALMGHTLTAATVFTTIALLNMLIAPLNAFPWVLNGLTEAWVSVKRIQRLLNLDDLNHYKNHDIDSENHDKIVVLSLKSASFAWVAPDNPVNGSGPKVGEDNSLPFKLTNVSFEIARGEFFGIIGKVGSGKTALLNAILAEMHKTEGHISKSENISGFGYVSQKPWLRRGTIRDNIVFGKAYEETKYKTVIEACGLTDDVMLLGNNACIGEGGSALSGGQAARIALARAVYQDKQIYLFDDILSAVDIKVGNHIYQKCIMGLLKYKTRILVTHSLQYLNQCDQIIVMENGTIKQKGPPSSILNEIDDCCSGYEISETDSTVSTHTEPLNHANDSSIRDDNSNNSMMGEETSAAGTIDFRVVVMYWKSIGHWLGISIFCSLILMQVTRNTTDLWLSHWVSSITPANNNTNVTLPVENNMLANKYNPKIESNNENIIDDLNIGLLELAYYNSNNTDDQVKYYLLVYGGFAVLNAIFTLFRAFMFAYGGIQAAVSIHKVLLRTVIKGKMKFFDLTPAGRLLNRFSSDTYTIDDSLPFIMNILLAQVFGVIGSILLTVYGLPWVCLIIVPLIPIYHSLQHRYRITSRELKRLSSVTLSPIYSHFNDTLEGAVVIRAFNKCNQWSQNGEHYVDRCQRATLSSAAAAQWLSLRLQLMGSAILTGGAIVAVAQRNFDSVNAGLVGLAISYALSVTSLLSGCINAFTETEREMIAVERVGEYINQVEPEEVQKENETNPPYGWPSLGIIYFNNVIMRYRPHITPSLKGVSFETGPGEKIGVVGRTGAGKSSLFTSLFRLCELQSGIITIDSVDISTLTLSTLRSRLSIIPQEPFIFKGSIRKNLDPFVQYSDMELWSALEKCGSKQIIRSKGGLHVSASNLSRGHMQLICLTRAILQNSKILCIDEATANIDQETDRLIQEAIRFVFRRSTVITIAHRISTILDSDRVIVMGDGQIMEFDKPEKLLNDPNSNFYRLIHNDNKDFF